MREIKFRGKTENDIWKYGSLLIDNPQKTYYIVDNEDGSGREILEKTIGQYTELKDKNRKEIYEGDIVKINAHNFDFGYKQEEIRQIKFIDGSFGIYKEISKNEYYFNDLATEVGYGEIDYYEVIGNIYENPELLEE